MPTYCFTCRECHHDFDTFAKVTERHKCACPKCGARKPYIDFGRQGAPAFGNKPWTGVASESQSLVFQKAGIDDIKRDCPSMKFIPDRTDKRNARAVFTSDKHHRQCLREMNRAREKYAAEGATNVRP
jgi:putative FmdB family regulatory protein